MWIKWSSFVFFVLLLLYFCEFRKKLVLRKNIKYLKPMVEMLENFQDIVYYCETYPKLNYLYLSPNIDKLLQCNLEEHLKNPEKIFDIVHPDDHEILKKKKFGILDFSKPITVRFKNAQGEYVWYEEYATPIYKDGKYVAVMGIFRNIHDKVTLQQELEYNSTHDALTDLYNRSFFQIKVKELNESKIPIGVIIADLDELKYVNDKYGHQKGDELVCEAANCLKSLIEKEMIVARIGGDEFAILMPNSSLKEVENYVEKIQRSLKNSSFSSIQMSIGYEHSDCSYGVMDQLLGEADAKMYENKKMKKLDIIN